MPASATTITFSAVDVITGTIADCFVDDVGPTSAGVHSSGISAMCRRATTGRCHSTIDYSAVGLVELRPDERDGRAKRDALARMDAARVRQAFMHWTEVNERGVLG